MKNYWKKGEGQRKEGRDIRNGMDLRKGVTVLD